MRALVLLACLSLGCGTTYVQRHVLGRPGAPHTRPVRVILDGDAVPPATAVALVQAIGRGLNADLAHLIVGLREEAQRLGCDAVVQVRIARGHATATAVGFAVRWGSEPGGVSRSVPAGTSPWSPPPPLPAATPPQAPGVAPPPWSSQ